MIWVLLEVVILVNKIRILYGISIVRSSYLNFQTWTLTREVCS
jgi:hypothetical protein